MATNGFRYGFKTQAEKIALELRGELGLVPKARLDPLTLAAHLCIPVLPIDKLHHASDRDVQHLIGAGRDHFSAATIYVSEFKRVIIFNPSHALTRQMNSLCHELSHIVLEHAPEKTPPGLLVGRNWNGVQEAEADWLASCLLIPRVAVLEAVQSGWDDQALANQFGVSRQLARWRMNMTGAKIHAQRLAALKTRGG